MRKHVKFHRHFFIALIGVPLLCWSALNIPVPQTSQNQDQPIQYSPQFFKLVTAGYWPAAVEGMWISLIQEVGERENAKMNPQKVRQFYDLATDLDPLAYVFYEQAGVFFSFFKDDGLNASHFFEKGLTAYDQTVTPNYSEQFRNQFWFHPYTLAIFNGYTQGFDLQDWPKAKVAFLKAAEMPGSPPYLQKMKEWLKEQGSEKLLARKVLTLLIRNTEDPDKKQKFEQKLKQLEVQT